MAGNKPSSTLTPVISARSQLMRQSFLTRHVSRQKMLAFVERKQQNQASSFSAGKPEFLIIDFNHTDKPEGIMTIAKYRINHAVAPAYPSIITLITTI
jgi:hypothetical protein